MDVERTMQFLLEQQAAAEARHAVDDARHAQWKTAIEQTQMKQLEMIDKLIDLSKRHENRLGDIDKLLDLSKSHENRLEGHENRLGDVEAWSKEMKEWSKEMKEWSKQTQEKLDALIAVVDGLVRRKN